MSNSQSCAGVRSSIGALYSHCQGCQQVRAQVKRLETEVHDMEIGLLNHSEPTVPVYVVSKWLQRLKDVLAEGGSDGN